MNPDQIISELLKTISPSRLIAWHRCRLQFWFKYVLQMTKPVTAARHVGHAVHGVLKSWNKARWKNESVSLKQLHDLFQQEWAKQVPGIDWEGAEDQQKQYAFALLDTYARQSPIPPDEKPEGVEVMVDAEIDSGLPKLHGIIDLVRAGGVIVDFKTIKASPNPALVLHQNETQLTAYALIYRHSTGRQEQGLELHHLVKNKSPKLIVTGAPPATEKQKTRFLKSVESYASGLSRKDIVPSPGLQCASCEFLNECKAWS